MSHNDAVRMTSFMVGELLASAKARRADIDAISVITNGISALDTSGMRQVALAAITLNLQARLVYGQLWH
jgi:hypothetical protein